jgi:hypothetical protein
VRQHVLHNDFSYLCSPEYAVRTVGPVPYVYVAPPQVKIDTDIVPFFYGVRGHLDGELRFSHSGVGPFGCD